MKHLAGDARPSVADPVATGPLLDRTAAGSCPVRSELDHTVAVAHRRKLPGALDVAREQIHQALLDSAATTVAGALGPESVAVMSGAAVAERVGGALDGAVRVLVDVRLPDDGAGWRRGRADLLVRARPDGAGTGPVWLPVIVKQHAMTRAREGSSLAVASLTRPDPASAEVLNDVDFRRDRLHQDGMELAHLWRLLEHAELVGPDDRAMGGVVDRDGALWWIDLGEAEHHSDWSDGPQSLLAVYDHEFGVRVELLENLQARAEDPSLPRLRLPMRISECGRCPWQEVCQAELLEADDISLLPRFRARDAAVHAERGLTTRRQVAGLDHRTATALFGEAPADPILDLVPLLSTSTGRFPTLALTTVIDLTPEMVDRLEACGLRTVEDLDLLDPRTLAYSGTEVSHLPTFIDQARAAVSGQVHRARGVQRVEVTRADIEIDVDMENVDAGVYLWGTNVAGEGAALEAVGLRPGYHPFFSWDPMDPSVQAEVFGRFWTWLERVRTEAGRHGISVAAYCYTSAEHVKMRQIVQQAPAGSPVPTLAQVDDLVAGPQWVDLYDVVRANLVTGDGLGLKKVAPLAGFGWRDDDPGGLQSMLWHQVAVTDSDAAVRAAHRARLLAYNEDDVLATLAVREWLDGVSLPAIEDWEP